MSAIDIRSTDTQAIAIEARPSIALPMTAWATLIIGLWPVGLAIACLERGKSSSEVADQYRYLIRTIWIGALFLTVSGLLCLVLIGSLAMIATAVWFYARCVRAMLAISRREPIRDPQTWLV